MKVFVSLPSSPVFGSLNIIKSDSSRCHFSLRYHNHSHCVGENQRVSPSLPSQETKLVQCFGSPRVQGKIVDDSRNRGPKVEV